ncbi:MAG: YbhB/YbcL family Raf kinase inhibitor-like protein [Parcubacteria group bacterium]|nr:MAG: YbhB/YbcL family Raf kinase inhibitor-like protein [Parcubacteria group bacterium]
MNITSTAFQNNDLIPAKYTCDGQNINPPLSFAEIPEGTQSLVLIMDDPDAIKPAGKVWDHWLVWNIMPGNLSIAEDTKPAGIVGMNSGGKQAYGGPCPPDGEHSYVFTLYALDNLLDLPFNSTKADVLKEIQGHVLDTAQLIGIYKR